MNTSLSLLVPIYNEGEGILLFHDKIIEIFRGRIAEVKLEIVYTDDGSNDETWSNLEKIISKAANNNYFNIKILQHKTNYGQHAALYTCYKHATSKYVATLDSDLQNDPRDITKMLDSIERNKLDLISTHRVNRSDPFWRKTISFLFAKIFLKLIGLDLKDLGSPLVIYNKEFLDQAFVKYERYKLTKSFTCSIPKIKFEEFPIKYEKRQFGKSKYGIFKLIKLFLFIMTDSVKSPFSFLYDHFYKDSIPVINKKKEWVSIK